ncbi:hypothetical protein SAMN05216198_0365 [Halopseudomonas litoralis]|uniref:Uncharacterized protein n=1 Tax=Halopseudomonas litoralis TaxID=797277 RepID=A0A1H1LRI7_9GAMM|nr:hypothetical protein SAMN05216198_0365 [Halopseudomonas litoralis]
MLVSELEKNPERAMSTASISNRTPVFASFKGYLGTRLVSVVITSAE